MVPLAIIFAGLVIGGAIYFRNSVPGGQTGSLGEAFNPDPLKEMTAVTSADWVRGDINAPITIVEYSDLECPFCKRFHETMTQIFDEYGTKGKNQVAWVYRHFPLDQLHQQARPEAEAAECAGKLGGPPGSRASNDAFWQFTDKIFEKTPSNDGLDLNLLPQFAEELGLDRAAFEKCVADKETAELVEADLQEALKIGGTGTPFPIVITKDGQKTALAGAVPLDTMRQALDKLLVE